MEQVLERAMFFQPHIFVLLSIALGVSLRLNYVLRFYSANMKSYRWSDDHPWKRYFMYQLPMSLLLILVYTLVVSIPLVIVYQSLSIQAQAIVLIISFAAGWLFAGGKAVSIHEIRDMLHDIQREKNREVVQLPIPDDLSRLEEMFAGRYTIFHLRLRRWFHFIALTGIYLTSIFAVRYQTIYGALLFHMAYYLTLKLLGYAMYLNPMYSTIRHVFKTKGVKEVVRYVWRRIRTGEMSTDGPN